MSRPDLIVFDIDGTLVDSMALEGIAFTDALRTWLGVADVETDWSRYRHYSDAGIAAEAFERARHRSASPAELNCFQSVFRARLERELAVDAPAVTAIPGAVALLEALQAQRDVGVAIATGCFHWSAEAKLRSAGLPWERWPVATCDDAPDRPGIFTKAVERSQRHYGRTFREIVYVGDGVWDARACARLEWRMVGIGGGAHAELLRAHGVAPVIAAFPAVGDFLQVAATASRVVCPAPTNGSSDAP